jgi:hypothetical protein
MSLINDQRILLLEITNEFTCGKKPLNEVIDYFYNHKVATEIKKQKSRDKKNFNHIVQKAF